MDQEFQPTSLQAETRQDSTAEPNGWTRIATIRASRTGSSMAGLRNPTALCSWFFKKPSLWRRGLDKAQTAWRRQISRHRRRLRLSTSTEIEIRQRAIGADLLQQQYLAIEQQYQQLVEQDQRLHRAEIPSVIVSTPSQRRTTILHDSSAPVIDEDENLQHCSIIPSSVSSREVETHDGVNPHEAEAAAKANTDSYRSRTSAKTFRTTFSGQINPQVLARLSTQVVDGDERDERKSRVQSLNRLDGIHSQTKEGIRRDTTAYGGVPRLPYISKMASIRRTLIRSLEACNGDGVSSVEDALAALEGRSTTQPPAHDFEPEHPEPAGRCRDRRTQWPDHPHTCPDDKVHSKTIPLESINEDALLALEGRSPVERASQYYEQQAIKNKRNSYNNRITEWPGQAREYSQYQPYIPPTTTTVTTDAKSPPQPLRRRAVDSSVTAARDKGKRAAEPRIDDARMPQQQQQQQQQNHGKETIRKSRFYCSLPPLPREGTVTTADVRPEGVRSRHAGAQVSQQAPLDGQKHRRRSILYMLVTKTIV